MKALEIILGVLVLIVSLAIIAVVLFQQGHRSGVGAISGAADTFLSKNKAKTADRILLKGTTVLAIVFFVLLLAAAAVGLLK